MLTFDYPAMGTGRVLVWPIRTKPMQGVAAVIGFCFQGGNFLGDFSGNWVGLAPADFGIDLDAANGLATRKCGGAPP